MTDDLEWINNKGTNLEACRKTLQNKRILSVWIIS